jgi:hypothetical protein
MRKKTYNRKIQVGKLPTLEAENRNYLVLVAEYATKLVRKMTINSPQPSFSLTQNELFLFLITKVGIFPIIICSV